MTIETERMGGLLNLPCPFLSLCVSSFCSIKWKSAVTVISILNLVIFIIELIVGGAKVSR